MLQIQLPEIKAALPPLWAVEPHWFARREIVIKQIAQAIVIKQIVFKGVFKAFLRGGFFHFRGFLFFKFYRSSVHQEFPGIERGNFIFAWLDKILLEYFFHGSSLIFNILMHFGQNISIFFKVSSKGF